MFTKKNSRRKKTLSMLIVAVMGISVFTATASASNAVTEGKILQDTVAKISTVQKLNKDIATATKTLYLKPNANWIKSDARFAMCVTGESGSQWVSMTDLEDGYYSADVPAGDYTTVRFARMNPKSEDNTDVNKWNYSSEMTIPTDKTNCFTIEAGQWNDATGEWSVYVSKASLKKLYLKPNANWIKTDARFAMYVTGANGAEWVSMEDAGDGYYTAYVPSPDYTTVQFARMSGSSSANTLINRWNYSSSMTIPTKSSATNCYTIDDGQWNNVAGSWGVFTPTVYKADALYLKPNLNWTYNKDGKVPRLSAYLYGGTSPATWVSMTKVEDGNYRAVIPEGDYPKVQFIRMNPDTTENNWTNLWNDSAEMEIPTNGTNRFVLGDNEWSSALGEWDSITELETLYLKPNDNWKRGDARFSIYLYGGSSASKWVSMTGVGDGTYKADIPKGHYTKVIFVRMNPATTENKWDYNWNESTPQRIPVNVTDKFTIDADEWNSATGVWSAYNSEEDPTPSEFTVVFKDYNGTVLKTETVQAGKSATAPINPTRDGYDFVGWDKAFDNVTSDLIVTAKYKQKITTTYTVTFTDYDGKVLSSQNVSKGGNASLPVNPTKSGETFLGWSGNYVNVSKNETVRAVYSDEKNVFVIESKLGQLNDTVTVLVSIDGEVKTCAFDFILLYDSGLELISYDDDLNLDIVANPNAVDNGIVLNFCSVSDKTKQRDIIELTFKIKDNSKLTYPITLDVKSIKEISGSRINDTDYVVVNGVIKRQ